jgi:hypothetical protein
VFRRNPKYTAVKAKEAKSGRQHVYAFPQGTHRNAVGRLHNGQLVCRHGKAMTYKKFDRPPLDGSGPGSLPSPRASSRSAANAPCTARAPAAPSPCSAGTTGAA